MRSELSGNRSERALVKYKWERSRKMAEGGCDQVVNVAVAFVLVWLKGWRQDETGVLFKIWIIKISSK